MFDFAAAIAMLHAMIADGVIRNYAIGGAVAFVIWAEPIATQDVDVAIVVAQPTSQFDPLRPVFDWLAAHEIRMDGEHAMIAGVPVQFLPAWNPLIEEAIETAADADWEGMTIRVMRPAYLVASWQIDKSADTFRRRERAAKLIDDGIVTREEIAALVEKFEP